jgi:urease accessory protein
MNLRLLQISDSALPIGGYTHSRGLEAAIARRLVHDAATLKNLVRNWLAHLLGPLEGVVTACVESVEARQWPTLSRADALLTASVAPPTLRAASREMGGQLHSLASTWVWSAPGIGVCETESPAGRDWPSWNLPVIFGLLGAPAGSSAAETLQAYFHQALLRTIAAGVRAIPVGHAHGQQMIACLHVEIVGLSAVICGRTLDFSSGGSPLLRGALR